MNEPAETFGTTNILLGVILLLATGLNAIRNGCRPEIGDREATWCPTGNQTITIEDQESPNSARGTLTDATPRNVEGLPLLFA
jgi:hypothetical protein